MSDDVVIVSGVGQYIWVQSKLDQNIRFNSLLSGNSIRMYVPLPPNLGWYNWLISYVGFWYSTTSGWRTIFCSRKRRIMKFQSSISLFYSFVGRAFISRTLRCTAWTSAEEEEEAAGGQTSVRIHSTRIRTSNHSTLTWTTLSSRCKPRRLQCRTSRRQHRPSRRRSPRTIRPRTTGDFWSHRTGTTSRWS